MRAGAVLLCLWTSVGCDRLSRPGGGDASGRPLLAVTTVGMVADLVRQVGGSQVQVVQIMGSGIDPHLYKPTRDDVRFFLQADLVFYSGLKLEGKMIDTLVKLGRHKPVVAVTDGLDPSRLIAPQDSPGHYDPHVWMDVDLWSGCIPVVRDALIEKDPSHAAHYRQRAEQYADELSNLHRYGLQTVATIPQRSRLLITSHDAFHYFGRAYGLEVQGVQGISTESEAGLQRINQLVDLLVARQVAAVFVESSVPRKNIRALLEGARSRGHEVTIGAELFSDAMGTTGTYVGTYLGMLDHNITRVAHSLGGQAPVGGRLGKLTPAGAQE